METDADSSHFQPWKIHVQEEGVVPLQNRKQREPKGICYCPPPPIPPCILVAICLGCSLKISLHSAICPQLCWISRRLLENVDMIINIFITIQLNTDFSCFICIQLIFFMILVQVSTNLKHCFLDDFFADLQLIQLLFVDLQLIYLIFG